MSFTHLNFASSETREIKATFPLMSVLSAITATGRLRRKPILSFSQRSANFLSKVLSSIPVVLAQVTSPILTAWLADLRGDYHFAFMILSAYTAAGTLLFAFASKPVHE